MFEVASRLLLDLGLVFTKAPDLLLLFSALGKRSIDDGAVLKPVGEEGTRRRATSETQTVIRKFGEVLDDLNTL